MSDNPPAFPNDPRIQLGDDYQGMTLRDYFAGQALAGIMASRWFTDHAPKGKPENVAGKAFEIADAMLAERSKSREASRAFDEAGL